MTGLRRLTMPRGPAVLSVLGDLEKMLAGGEALQPVASDAPEGISEEVPEGVAVVVQTSGSTGSVKRAMLTADSLVASVTATHEVLGGPGRWLPAVPAHQVAGLQVLVRSVVAGTKPEVLVEGGFEVGEFVAATDRLTERLTERRYTAVVPTQLGRLLDDPAGVRALRRFDGVL